MRLAIEGARLKLWPWTARDNVRALVLRIVTETLPDTVIISGDSPGGGVDLWARLSAFSEKRSFVAHPPRVMPGMSRERYAEACHLRNQQIVDDCDELIAIVAPGSRGTWDSVRRAKRAGKLREILRPLELALVRGATT